MSSSSSLTVYLKTLLQLHGTRDTLTVSKMASLIFVKVGWSKLSSQGWLGKDFI